MIIDVDVTTMDNVYGFACIFQNETNDKLGGPYTNSKNINDVRGFAVLKAVDFAFKICDDRELELWFYHMNDDKFSLEKNIYENDINQLLKASGIKIKINNISVYEKNFTSDMSSRYGIVHNKAILSALKGKKINIELQKRFKSKNKMKIDTE